jgi:predicted acylesterase/phospholipase RssA
MKLVKYISMLLVVFYCASIFGIEKENDDKICSKLLKTDLNNFTLFRDPQARKKCRKYFFKDENIYIENRNKQLKRETNFKIGLALSGGGIRSNAIQLGLLTALHNIDVLQDKNEKDKSKIINRIDYISSVSGGTWAHLTYRANELIDEKNKKSSDENYFKNMYDYVTNNNIEYKRTIESNCLDFENVSFNQCKDFQKPLWASYHKIQRANVLLPAIMGGGVPGNTIREKWRQMILSHFLFSGDKDIFELASDKNTNLRPFPIFNASHSTTYTIGGLVGFPFEFNPYHFGTIADVSSARVSFCNFPKISEYFSRSGRAGFFYTNSKKDINFLSYIGLASSAVVPDIRIAPLDSDLINVSGLEQYFHYRDISPKNYNGNLDLSEFIRDYYTLTDGGHFDNLGLLSLLERDPDVIIVSDASADPSFTFDDFLKTKSLADLLLDMDVRINENTEVLKIKPEFVTDNNSIESNKLLFKGQYSPRLNSKSNLGKIIYLKPKWTIGFQEYLKTEAPHILKFLVSNSTGFPHSDTFVSSYSHQLVKVYYLLGVYMGIEVNKEMKSGGYL